LAIIADIIPMRPELRCELGLLQKCQNINDLAVQLISKHLIAYFP
jgi:hypothetical protein